MAKGRKLPSDYDGSFYVEASTRVAAFFVLVVVAGVYVVYRLGVVGRA